MMKSKLILIAAIISVIISAQCLNAQEIKTEKIKVYGKCDECKTRIETAATSVPGVKKANWNIETEMLEVTYDRAKTNRDDIQKAIAKVGHDTEKYKADDKTYEALPSCCHYDRSKSN